MRLAEHVFRYEHDGSGRAHLDTLRLGVVFAEVAFQGDPDVGVDIHRSEGTGIDAGVTSDAFVFVNPDDAVSGENGVGGAGASALCFSTLAADDGHAHDRMGVGGSHAYASLFRIVDFLPMDGAGDFAKPAAGTLFGHNHQFPPHIRISRNNRFVS